LGTKQIQATEDVAKEVQAMKNSLGKGSRVPKGVFNQIQREALTTYGLDNDEFIVKREQLTTGCRQAH
jgi:hypothetical protein